MHFLSLLALVANLVRLASTQACARDNCLRNLLDPRSSNAAVAFCRTFTQTVHTAATDVPSFLGGCRGNPSRVSSACSCAITPTTSTNGGSQTRSSTVVSSATQSVPARTTSTRSTSLGTTLSTSTVTQSNSSDAPTTSPATQHSTLASSPGGSTSAPIPSPSTSPASTCQRCATPGDSSQGGVYLLGIVSSSSISGCASSCAGTSACLAFAFDLTTNASCALYSATTDLLTAVAGVGGIAHTYVFYNIACYKSSCS